MTGRQPGTTGETLVLVGRETGRSRPVFETHARRLLRRGCADAVEVATYEREPVSELRGIFAAVEGDAYVVPMCVAHTNETTESIPAALTAIDGEVHYCEPVGYDPVITEALLDRAGTLLDADEGTSLVLVGMGNPATEHQRRVVEYHASRARSRSEYGDVLACYLVQNPAAECVRYNVATDRAVAVPVFVPPGPATDAEIPAKLELDRGGMAYADPLGSHEGVTTAIESTLESRRALVAGDEPDGTFEAALVDSHHPVATDGQGPGE